MKNEREIQSGDFVNMITKCEFCGGALKFDADIQMLVCEHCTSMFPVTETEEEKALTDKTPSDLHENAENDLMDCREYECKSCGARLIINDVETATYCAYCGQPTIVFDRIAIHRRPKYIIPFSITKDYAIANIREKFIQGEFVPDEIKNFKPDLLRGIYVPYLLYDIRIKDRQLIKGQYSEDKDSNSSSRFFYREAAGSFHEIPVDASQKLSNESSERLEPFYERGMTDFKVEYLSGFYADLMDSNPEHLKTIALSRARDMFNEQVIKSVPATSCNLIENRPHYEFEQEEYALFPVWFMVFHRNEETYTIMVNGQTGKVVGGLPANEDKLIHRSLLLGIILSVIGFILLPAMYALGSEVQEWANYLIMFGIPTLTLGGYRNIKSLKKSLALTSSKSIKDFVSERQDS